MLFVNYGKNNLSRRKKKISSKKKMQKKRVGVRLFKAVIVSLLLLCVIGVAGAGVFAYQIIQNTPEVTAEDIMPQGYTSFIVDQNGNQIERLNDSSSNRVYRTYDQIPEYMAHAFVAIEDERFYEHNGIDLRGILRAGMTMVASGFKETQGASTITQQLLKNSVFDFMSEDTFVEKVERKLQEQYLAIELEKIMTKQEILEAYLNTINLGQNTLGVQAAANRYFNKNVSDLTISEAATIAAITQNPSKYNPISHPDYNAERRKRVLDAMLRKEHISQEEYNEALEDDVYERIQTTNESTGTSTVYSYYVDATIEEVIKDLQEVKGYTSQQAYSLVYNGGLTIETAQDPEIQAIMDEETSDPENYPENVKYGLEYALTVVKPDGSRSTTARK